MDNIKENTYYIDKILEHVNLIIRYTSGLSYEKFIDDEMLIDACMFRLVQIAENIKGISDDFKEAHSSVPWRQIVGFRNGVVHDYGKTDYSIVYEILSNDIYKLKFELEKNDK